MNLALVVTAFNRDFELRRLLSSLERTYSFFPQSIQITLIISIDKNENEAVYQRAKDFHFPLGPKTIIEHPKNLGLRNHILFAAGLVKDFDALIMLEDDLMVSKYMWNYVVRSLNFYKDDERIAQISLYSQVYNETAAMAFTPNDDGYDNFFLQVPSSWGQIWTKEQWSHFEKWYQHEYNDSYASCCPPDVQRWPKSSWKKIFFAYIISTSRYVVYPRRSLTTNFLSTGTHHKGEGHYLQAPLLAFDKRDYRFSSVDESEAIYDSFLERCDEKFLSILKTHFNLSEIELDLYGQKNIEILNSHYVITSKNLGEKYLKAFARQLHPHELNLIYNDFSLITKSEIFKIYDIRTTGISGRLPLVHDQVLFYYRLPSRLLNRNTNARILSKREKIIKHIKKVSRLF